MKFLNFYWSIICNIIFKKFIKVYEILIFLKIYIILHQVYKSLDLNSKTC